MMRVGGERAALSGLEIHHVVADRAALERQRGVARLREQREIDAEGAVGGLRSGDRLKHQVDRRAPAHQLERRGHMRQDAALRRDIELGPHLVQHGEERMRALGAIGRGIDADDGVAGAEQQGRRECWPRCAGCRQSGGWAAAAPTSSRADQSCCGSG